MGNTENKVYIPLSDMYEICNNKGSYDSTENLLLTAIIDNQQFVDTTIKQLSSSNNITAALADTLDNNDIEFYELVLRISRYMIYSIIVFILLMLYICIAIIALSSKKQIALCKAVGYNNVHIFHIIFWESIIISLIGYLLGVLIAVLANAFVIKPILYAKIQLTLSYSIPLLSIAVPLASIIPIAFLVSLFSYIKVKNIYPSILLKETKHPALR